VRVTEPAQRAVRSAKQEAGRLGHDRVGAEHLLLALAREGEGIAPGSWRSSAAAC
jgi:ATP-dependent Clp protease ATP-binding subunit ClpA